MIVSQQYFDAFALGEERGGDEFEKEKVNMKSCKQPFCRAFSPKRLSINSLKYRTFVK